MKKVLITGANSYLGDNLKKYIEKKSSYLVDIIDMKDSRWNETSFEAYFCVINVCAIVHNPHAKKELYFKVNRDLAIEIAQKAKKEGVELFVQISTANVFGIDLGVIDEKSQYKPKSYYGISKLEADNLLEEISCISFKVIIIRPPMIYGKGCRGNYPKLEKFALKSRIFPRINNKKDFIFIDNICDFILFVINEKKEGVYYPKDQMPISTSVLVDTICKYNNKKMHLTRIFNPIIMLFIRFNHTIKVMFGDNYFNFPKKNNWSPPFTFFDALSTMYKDNNEVGE